MPTVVKAADEYHIGVFPSADAMVADGGVLGLGVDQYMLGVKAAQMVIAVLDGADPAQAPPTDKNTAKSDDYDEDAAESDDVEEDIIADMDIVDGDEDGNQGDNGDAGSDDNNSDE